MNKGIAPIAIILIIIGVLALGGGVWYWQQQELQKLQKQAEEFVQPTQQQNNATDETADWKTYRNEKYGFEVEYPSSWHFDPFGLLSMNGPFSLTSLPRSAYGEGGALPNGGAEVTIWNTTSSLSELINNDLRGGQVISRNLFDVAGRSVTRIVYRIQFTPIYVERVVVLYLPKDERLYKFILTYYENDPKEVEFTETFEKILSTFKFID